jgi:hypothetical protein
MNHSIYSADRATHLKIVVVTLLTATVVTGLFLHSYSKSTPVERAAVLTAGKPMTVGSSTLTITR